MEYLLIAGIVFVAVFVQALAGFGAALVAMPLLVPLIGLQKAPPLMALVSGSFQIVLLIRYWKSLQIRTVGRMTLASIPAVFLGMWGLRLIDERITLSLLATVTIGYGIYALTRPRLPELRSGFWVYLAGFTGGLLGGAYNTSGPPVVIYGNCKRWSPETFKSNLQAFFLITCAMILFGHALCGNITAQIGKYYAAVIPAIVLGIAIGLSLDRYIDPDRFKRIVLYLLIVLGIRMLLRVILGM